MRPVARVAPAIAAAWIVTSIVTTAQTAARPRGSVPERPDEATIAHVLSRLGFGPRPGDIERIRAMGLAVYIEQQLHPERLDLQPLAARLARYETLTLDSEEIARRFFLPVLEARRQRQVAQPAPPLPAVGGVMNSARVPLVELSSQKLIRAVYSDAQLEEVLVDFWFNHFNVFAGKGATRQYLTEYERDAIRPFVLGSFRDMLGAVARSPAMLFYLDNWMSTSEQAMGPQRRGLNENYGRELLELHTLGVDGGYTQQDVVAVARAFTGWTIDRPRQGGSFRFNVRLHDRSDKVVLGHRLAAGGGQLDGERVLDLLATHPATARHLATKLARRFVSDEPPAALVERAARVFRDTHGNLREVTRAVITAPEFFAASARRAKVKSPFEFVTGALRAVNATVHNPARVIGQLRELGQPIYGAPPPTGYDDVAAAWVSSGALLNRMNFAVSLASNRLPGIDVNLRPLLGDGAIETARARAVSQLLHGRVSEATNGTLNGARDRATLVALTLGSPEFQRK